MSTPITRERVSVVVINDNSILCFLGVDPKDKTEYYFLPGGGIEPNESLADCGRREALEETGYRVNVLEKTHLKKEYPFHWDGKDYWSITHFFRAELADSFKPAGIVDDIEYNKGPRWIPLINLDKSFSYTPEILEAIKALL